MSIHDGRSQSDHYFGLLNSKIASTGGNEWKCLTSEEQTAMMAALFALDVTNGGFEKFFLNRGELWRETLYSIRALGATRLAALFEKALSVFPGNMPSADPVTRCNQLIAAEAKGDDQLWRLSCEYWELQAQSAEHCLHEKLEIFAAEQLCHENTPRPQDSLERVMRSVTQEEAVE